MLFAPAGLAGLLCYWQLRRKAWKEDLVAQRTTGLKQQPADIFSYKQTPPAYTKVFVEGVYDVERAMFVGVKPHG